MNKPTQAAQQLSEFSIHRSPVDGSVTKTGMVIHSGDQAPPASISRPFTPSEFLHWLSWHETNGNLSLSEIHAEAELMFRSRGLIK